MDNNNQTNKWIVVKRTIQKAFRQLVLTALLVFVFSFGLAFKNALSAPPQRPPWLADRSNRALTWSDVEEMRKLHSRLVEQQKPASTKEKPKLTPSQLATKIRTKYPGSYDKMPDLLLAQRVVAKYPEIAQSVDFDTPLAEPKATQGPDGNIYQFPDGTTSQQALSYFQKKGIGPSGSQKGKRFYLDDAGEPMPQPTSEDVMSDKVPIPKGFVLEIDYEALAATAASGPVSDNDVRALGAALDSIDKNARPNYSQLCTDAAIAALIFAVPFWLLLHFVRFLVVPIK